MATTINEPKEITLPDGTVIAVRPLKISMLREFMKTFTSIEEVAEDAAKLEDILDLPTVYRIIEEASGTVVGNQFVGGRG